MSLLKTYFLPIFLCSSFSSLFSQKIENPFERFKNASWLKNADIAVAKNSEIYTFDIENTEGVARVAVTKKVDEWVYPAKLGQTFFNRILCYGPYIFLATKESFGQFEDTLSPHPRCYIVY